VGLAAGLAGAAAIVVTYPALWRERCLTWGTQDDEPVRPLPGDELLADPGVVTTRAVGIDAPAAAVWPWLIQMGPGRAGAYTYDWIENLAGLDMHSSDEIVPELQHMAVGDCWQLGATGPVLRVARLEVESSLVLRTDDANWVWAFVLVPDGNGCRLISRNRIRWPGTSPVARFGAMYVMEPGSLVMERKMLLGIRARAERHHRLAQAAPSN
jgi:hypothetical protein